MYVHTGLYLNYAYTQIHTYINIIIYLLIWLECIVHMYMYNTHMYVKIEI